MNNPISVNSFSPRDAITDSIYRAVIGLDTNDLTLFESAWINKEDAVFTMNGSSTKGLDAINDSTFKHIGPLDTTYFITNTRISMENGANAAVLTAYALAQHYKTGEGFTPDAKRLLSGSMYQIDVVKDEKDGLWKMKEWAMKIVWVEGDMSIVMP